MTHSVDYPTVADVARADLPTLLRWRARLPDPDTDVRRAVVSRIKRRIATLQTGSPEVNETPGHEPFSATFSRIFESIFGKG